MATGIIDQSLSLSKPKCSLKIGTIASCPKGPPLILPLPKAEINIETLILELRLKISILEKLINMQTKIVPFVPSVTDINPAQAAASQLQEQEI